MGAPADDAGDGKDGGVQLQRDVQHIVDKAGVEVHVGGNALVDVAFFGNDLGRQALDHIIEVKVLFAALGLGQLLHKALEHHRAGVGQRVDRVAHAVDQALVVECLLVQDLAEVVLDLVLVGLVADGLADVVDHLHHLDVGAAVLGAFQRAERRRHDRVGVRPGGGDHAGGKGGVVAAAVLHVQKQGGIQHVGFQRGVAAVGAQHLQQVFGGGKLRLGAVDVHAVAVDIIIVGVVAVYRQHGEHADQLDALLQLGLQAAVADGVIVGGQRQHAAGQRVHQVPGGGFHDHVAGKIGGQVPALGQHVAELGQLAGVGQLAHQKQVGGFLKAEAFAVQAADQVVDIVAAVPQLALAGGLFAVYHLERVDAGNMGDAGQHALAVLVAQAALDAEPVIQSGVDAVVFDADVQVAFCFVFDLCVVCHGCLLFRLHTALFFAVGFGPCGRRLFRLTAAGGPSRPKARRTAVRAGPRCSAECRSWCGRPSSSG